MRKLICKIWRFLVGMMKTIIDTVKDVLIDLTNAMFEILGVVVSGVGKLLGGLLKSPLTWLAGGLALWWFLGSDDEEENRAAVSYHVLDTASSNKGGTSV